MSLDPKISFDFQLAGGSVSQLPLATLGILGVAKSLGLCSPTIPILGHTILPLLVGVVERYEDAEVP